MIQLRSADKQTIIIMKMYKNVFVMHKVA